MQIAIVGAGAIGSFVGAALLEKGLDPLFIGRGDHARAMRESGLTLQSAGGSVHLRPRVQFTHEADEPQDILLVSTKMNALEQLLATLEQLSKPGTTIVFLQNGLPDWIEGPIGRRLHDRNLVIGLVYTANEITEPGHLCNRSANNAIKFGGIRETDRLAAQEISQIFHETRLSPLRLEDLTTAIWEKLIINMTGSIIALILERQSAVSRECPELAALFPLVWTEAIGLAQIAGADVSKFPDAETQLARLNTHFPSILQDYWKKRPSEIDHILTHPLRIAQKLKYPCPHLTLLHAFAKAKLSTAGAFKTNDV